MTRAVSPELTRARYRILFFLALTVCCLVAGARLPAMFAGLALLAGVISLRTATGSGSSASSTFIAIDWLMLGLALAVSGGPQSPLVMGVPLLTLLEVLPGDSDMQLNRLVPAIGAVAVLLLADPSLGGQRALRLFESAVLMALGVGAAWVLTRAGTARRRGTARCSVNSWQPFVDPATGLSTARRVGDLLGSSLREAANDHEPLSVVCVRLDHFDDTRTFLGTKRADAVVAGIARRLRKRIQAGDLAFRVSADTFLLVFSGRLPGEVRGLAAGMRRELSTSLIDRHRQTVSIGVASYPAVRTVEDLLWEAHRDLLQGDAELRPAASL